MKNSRKIKKRFLALLGCAALGAVLAPAALAAEDLAAPAAGDPFSQDLPRIIGVAPDEDDSKNDGNQKGL